jgi:hypothetical protein
VAILIIDEFHVAVIERESQPPVSADTHAPVVRELSLEGMQSPARDVHVRRLPGNIERRELSRQPGRMRGLNAGLAAGSEKPLDAFVAKRPYHRASVAYGVTHHKPRVRLSIVPGDPGSVGLIGGAFRSHCLHLIPETWVTLLCLRGV